MAILSKKTGSEGPCHDPYGYEEWQFTASNGSIATMHLGLVCWISFGEKTRVGRCAPQEEVTAIWNAVTGLPANSLDRIYSRIRSRCPACNCRRVRSMAGMPGESFNVCVRCGEVVSCDFNERSVI